MGRRGRGGGRERERKRGRGGGEGERGRGGGEGERGREREGGRKRGGEREKERSSSTIISYLCGLNKLIITRSELASLAPSFRGHNFVQNTRATTYDCAHVCMRMRIFILVLKLHPQSVLRGVVCETNVAATCILLRSIS